MSLNGEHPLRILPDVKHQMPYILVPVWRRYSLILDDSSRAANCHVLGVAVGCIRRKVYETIRRRVKVIDSGMVLVVGWIQFVQSNFQCSDPRQQCSVYPRRMLSIEIGRRALHLPNAMLVISFTSWTYCSPAKTLQPPLQKLRGPAEAVIGSIAEAEDGKREILEEVAWKIGATERVPERSEGPWFLAGTSGGHDEQDQRFVDQIFLGSFSVVTNEDVIGCLLEDRCLR
jgi:hypothetical protein